MRLYHLRTLLLIGLLGIPLISQGMALTGQVVDPAGNGVSNALVTLSGAGLIASSITLTSNRQGEFQLAEIGQPSFSQFNNLQISLRKPGYKLLTSEQNLSSRSGASIEVVAENTGNFAEAAPPSAWFSAIPESTEKHVTVKLCVACHQFPSPKVKGVSSAIGHSTVAQRTLFWGGAMRYMAYIFASYFTPPEQLDRTMPEYPAASMFAASDEQQVAPFLARQLPTEFSHLSSYAAGAPIASHNVAVYEYDMAWQPKGLIHDVTVAKGPADQTYGWGAEAHHSKLVRINPRSGERKIIDTPLPNSGIHTLVPDHTGNIWATLQFADAIGRFDPIKEEWTLYRGFSPYSAIHSLGLNARGEIAFDRQGRLWSNLIGLNRIASLDPTSGKIEEFLLPQKADHSAFYTQSYGLALRSDRRHLWVTQLGSNRLVEFDTETGQTTRTVQLERGSGPRRLAIDQRDVLWIPLYGSGQLLEFDAVKGVELARYDLPDRAAAPYTLSWDHQRNRVWISGGNSDSIYCFDVSSKQFTVYPLPHSESVMRALPVDPETGELWSAYSTQENVAGASRMFRLVPGTVPTE